MVMKIGYRREGRSDEICSVGLVVAAFSTDPIEQLAAQSEVCDQIYWKAE